MAVDQQTAADHNGRSAAGRIANLKKRRVAKGDPRTSTGRSDWSAWPTYDEASAGLRNYWYPVTWSSEVTRRPLGLTVCGEQIVLQREEQGVVHAFPLD